MTAYGRRRRQQERKVSQAAPLAYPGISAGPEQRSTTIAQRWLYVVGIHAIGLALMFVVVHLTGGGLRVN